MPDPSPSAAVNAAASTPDFEFAALAEARNYRAALVREFSPHLVGKVLEVGAGIGQMTRAFEKVESIRSITALEPDSRFHPAFRRDNPRIPLVPGTVADLPDQSGWDAIVSINVLEHIEHDLDQLTAWASLLRERKGVACLFVPARPEIYAPIDRDFGHFRRYTAPELRSKLQTAGFHIERLSYFNSVGYLAWWMSFKILGQRSFGIRSVRLYDRFIFPAVHWSESHLCRPPIGQSLLAVARVP